MVILCAWIALLIAATIGHRAVNSSYSDTLSIPGSSAQAGLNVLQSHDPKAGGQGGEVVFTSDGAPVAGKRAAIEQSIDNLSQLPHVLAVSDPLSAATTSPSGQAAYASINFNQNPQKLGNSYIGKVNQAVQPATGAGVKVMYGGQLGQAAEPKARDMKSELIGIVIAVIVLLAGFGSIYAAGLPLLSAILAVITGVGTLGVIAEAVSFGTAAPTLAIMMGLGVGIDYALFMTTRFRQRMIDGHDVYEAIRTTVGASGRSVLIAATTVVIAMLGLYASGISFIGKLGLAAAITVAVAAFAALTLVPALLGFAGKSIDRHRVGAAMAEPTIASGGMHRYVRAIERRPWAFATGGIALLLVLAIPVLSMRVGHIEPSAEPASFNDHQAYEAIQKNWGPGANGPLTIVVQLPSNASASSTDSLARTLTSKLDATANVASVTPLKSTQDGELLVGRVIPDSGPGSSATTALVDKLQGQILPDALAGSGATGYVTGTTAASVDFVSTVSSRLPIIIAVVLIAAFLLLLAAFRSPVVALKAALLNLLSIGAAYGILVAVFQWGWGSSLLGVNGTVPIESYVPMLIFAIVFGLSMDYEVFLVSRIREHWLATGDNADSVATGLAQTARVITCAALIMASVFFAFLFSTKVDVKMLALGLGVSVLIDASIIRLIIVPSLMFVFDKWNWWTPRWLASRPRPTAEVTA
jgi:RND superfamily putative drug exporter